MWNTCLKWGLYQPPILVSSGVSTNRLSGSLPTAGCFRKWGLYQPPILVSSGVSTNRLPGSLPTAGCFRDFIDCLILVGSLPTTSKSFFRVSTDHWLIPRFYRLSRSCGVSTNHQQEFFPTDRRVLRECTIRDTRMKLRVYKYSLTF